MQKNFDISLQDSVGGHERKYLTVSLGEKENFTPLAPRTIFCGNTLEGQPLNTNGYMFGGQTFQVGDSQPAFLGENTGYGYDPHFLMLRGLPVLKPHQEYASVDSPTPTTNSERSEITEASADFNFLGGSQQLVRGQQQLDTSQLESMQQSAYNDLQLLQRQMMFKQIQEIQRQQQLQQLDGARQQGSQNHISDFTRQSSGGQYPSYINGTSVPDSSQIFMNRANLGASSATQGVLNQLMFAQEKGQPFHSALLVPQQFDDSNYRTPVSSGPGSVGQYSQLQGIDRDSRSLLTKASGHGLRHSMQPAAFSSSSVGNQHTISADHFALSQMGKSKQHFQGKNSFEQVPIHGLDAGNKPGNTQQKNSLQTNPFFPEFQGRQDGAGWLGTTQQKNTQLDTSQYFVPLDPMEQKILYHMDHNMWDTSLDKCADVNNGSFENDLEHSDNSNVFPSIQSGSWSALMQSAVAEASSSDTGMQEEWSGLTFQNTELSTENQHSNIVDSKKEQSAWLDNNMHSASSLSSRPYPNFNDSSMSSDFPGFQQSGIQYPLQQTEHLCQEDSHELNQTPPEKTGEWLDSKSVQERHGDQPQHVQPLEPLNNTLSSQIYEQSGYYRPHQQMTTSHENINQPHGKPQDKVNEVTHNQRDFQGFFWKGENDSRGLENMKHVNIPMNREGNEIVRKKQSQISDDPVLQNSYDKVGDSFLEKLQQRENSHDQYNLKQLSSHGQGHFDQSYFSDVTSDSMSLEKGRSTGFQRNLKPLDGTSRSNLDASTNLCKSIGSNSPNLYNQTSENVHGCLQNVGQSKENSTIPHYRSIDPSSLSMMTEAVFPNPSVSQHYNQFSSRGFTMRLLHPSQQLSYSNTISSSHGSPQLSSNLNATRSVNSGSAEKNQTLLALPSSIQSIPPLSESFQNARWDAKSHCMEQTDVATSFMQPHFVKVENQVHFASSAPVAHLSPQASLPSTACRYPQFDLASSQDTSQHISGNMCGKQYTVLEASPISQPLTMSRLSQPGGLSVRQQNIWSNNGSQQHNAAMEPNKISALNNTFEATPLVPLGFSDQNSQKCGLGVLERDMISTNSQECDHKDETAEQKAKSDIYDTLLRGGLARKMTNANAFPSSLLLVHPHQQDLNRLEIADRNGLTHSERDSLFDHFSKLPHIVSTQTLQKVKQLMKVGTEPKGVLDAQQVTAVSKENSTREYSKHGGQDSISELSSSPSANRKMLNLLTGGREDHQVKALSENPQKTRSRDFTSDGQMETQNEFNSKNIEGNNEENSQVNPLMAPSWFKSINGQIPSMYNELLTKHPGGHFSLMKPSENLYKHSSLDGIDSTDITQSDRVQSNAATTMVAADPLSSPYGLPSTSGEIAAIVRPKKRKFEAFELQPWHLEVQSTQRVMNISMAEQDWAHSTNRLTEKLENEAQMVEDGPMLRSKRRLILTTQVLQQLVSPAPSPILSADASSFYDSVVYFILRHSLGDACSLMCGKGNDLLVSLNNSNVMSKELETVKFTDDKYLEIIVERFSTRAVKLENDLQRLDRTTSILDLMVECQELERFSVINRFAKFHIRQAELTGNPSSNGLVTMAPKSCPQRYVSPHPIPRNLPEGVQCLSL